MDETSEGGRGEPSPPEKTPYQHEAEAGFPISEIIAAAHTGDIVAMESLRFLGVKIAAALRIACSEHGELARELARECDSWPCCVYPPTATSMNDIKRMLDGLDFATRLTYTPTPAVDADGKKVPAPLSRAPGVGLAKYLRGRIQDALLDFLGRKESDYAEAIRYREQLLKRRETMISIGAVPKDEIAKVAGDEHTVFLDQHYVACLSCLVGSSDETPTDWAKAGIAWLERECGGWLVVRNPEKPDHYVIQSSHILPEYWQNRLGNHRSEDPIRGFYYALLQSLTNGFRSLAFRSEKPE